MIEQLLIHSLINEHGLTQIETIQEGGQSLSFKCFDPLTQRDVFIKAYEYSEKYQDTLLVEPRILSNLFNSNGNSRKHIANIYDVVPKNLEFSCNVNNRQVEGEEFLIIKMEYCGANNLGEVLQQSRLSLHESLHFAKQLCEGLHFLHSVNILHRDIKPENLVVNGKICKLIDFGSTTRVTPDQQHIIGTSVKTANYTPPESFLGDRYYGKKSDIYQIGLVLLEMINGRISMTENYYPKSIIRECRNEFGRERSEFSNYEKNQLYKRSLAFLASRNKIQSTICKFEEYVPKNLQRLIGQTINSNLERRPASCAILRSELSQLSIPNWKKEDDLNFTVMGWKGKDYRICLDEGEQKSCVLEVSRTGKNNFRKNKAIKKFEDAVRLINA